MANLQILDLVILRDTGQKEEKDSLNFIHICALKKKKIILLGRIWKGRDFKSSKQTGKSI